MLHYAKSLAYVGSHVCTAIMWHRDAICKLDMCKANAVYELDCQPFTGKNSMMTHLAVECYPDPQGCTVAGQQHPLWPCQQQTAQEAMQQWKQEAPVVLDRP